VLPGELDLRGNPRIDSDCKGPRLPDIGAYELTLPHACPIVKEIPKGLPPIPPVVSALSFSAPRLKGHDKHARPPKAGRLTFTLNVAATVEVALRRRVTGHFEKHACVFKHARKAKAKPCQMYVSGGIVTASGDLGKNTLEIPSLSLLRRMHPGRYKLVVTAVGQGNVRSGAQSVSFTLR
jgi:hypothetical protein